MPTRRTAIVAVSVATAATAVLALSASAQSIWPDRSVRPGMIQLEATHPMRPDRDDDFPTSAVFLDLRVPYGQASSFVAELAMETSGPGAGNPYVGVETPLAESGRTWIEAGLRLPLATNDGSTPEVGLTADLARWDAFALDAIVLRIAPHYGRIPREGTGFDLRIVSEVWLPETFAGDPEFFAVYGGQFLFRSEKARGGVGLTGRWWTTRGGGFGESALHQVEGHIALAKGTFRPGAIVRLPLDDWDESLDVML